MATEVGALQASLNLDVRPFANGVSEAIGLSKTLGETLREALGDTSQGFLSLLQDVSAVTEEISRLRAEMYALSAEVNQAGATEAFIQMQQHSAGLRDDINSTISAFGELSSVIAEAESAIRGVSGETGETLYLMNDTTGELHSLTREAAEAARAMAQTAEEAAKTSTSSKEAKAEARQLKAEAKQTAKEMRRAEKEADKLAQKLDKSALYAKDLKRIIAGIVVSQSFYALSNMMQDLVRGSIKFVHNMDMAGIAFKYLLKDADQAVAMVNTLQDFAIHSPLNTPQVMDATRKLMAMGFTAKSVVPTLQIMADTAAVFTGEAGEMSDMISHVALALGQMRASGKVMTQELRQLYNAGIPVFDILQEELKLTADQVRNIGKIGVDSRYAVVALLKGLAKEYSGAAREFTKTIPGAMAVIEDSFQVLFSLLTKAPYGAFKAWVNGLSDIMEAFVVISRNYGTGGFFQAMFPKEMHLSLRLIVGSLQQLAAAMSAVGAIAKSIFAESFKMIAYGLGFVLPPITVFINALAQIIRVIWEVLPPLKYLAGAFGALFVIAITIGLLKKFFAILKLGKLITWVAGCVKALAASFTDLSIRIELTNASTRRLLIGLLAVVAVLALILSMSTRARNAMKKFADAFKSLGVGFNPDDILQPEFEPPPTGDFDGGLRDIIDSVEDLGDEADKTNKKLKNMFNQSFDEVFLIDPKSGSGVEGIADLDFSFVLDGLDELLDKVDALAMSGDFWKDWANVQDYFNVGAIDMADAMDGIHDAGEVFWGTIFEVFSTPTEKALGLAGLLSLFLAKLLITGPMGAIVGLALLSAYFLASLYWEEIAAAFEKVGLNDTTALLTALSVPLAALVGFKLGGPLGAAIGAVGAFVASWVIGAIREGIETGDWAELTKLIAMGVGGAFGFVLGGPAGAAIGMAIGALVGGIIGEMSKAIEEGDWASLALPIGMGLGAAIGFVMGGPVGAMLGATIGLLVGWLVEKLIRADWSKVGQAFTQPFKNFGKLVKGLFQEEIWDPIKKAFEDGDWLSLGFNIVLGIIKGLLSAPFIIIGAAITLVHSILAALMAALGIKSPAKATVPIGENIVLGIIEGLKAAAGNLLSYLGQLGADAIVAIMGWLNDLTEDLRVWISDVKLKFNTFLSDLWTDVKKGVKNIYETFKGWIDDLWNNIFSKFFGWISDALTKLKEFFSESAKADKMGSPSIASSVRSVTPMSGLPVDGHKDGGIFRKEHVAWISEGNKAEAVVPLENPSAMRPFVEAISEGVATAIMPALANMGGSQSDLRPLYVGTLIADERSLKELERKMEVIRVTETKRRG